MKSASDLIASLGGVGSVAALLGVPYQTVAAWDRRGSIPVRHWPALIDSEAGTERGVTSEVLMIANSQRGETA